MRKPTLFLAPEGGASGGAPAGQPAATEPTAPQPVSREEFQQVREMLSAAVRREDKHAKERDTLTAQIKTLTERLEAMAQPKPPEDKKPAEGETPEVQEMRRALLKQTEETQRLTKQFEAEKQAREAERANRLDQARRTTLAQRLAAKGVTGPNLEAAMAVLYDAGKRVVHDEQGERIVMKVQRTYNGTKIDDLVDLDEGLDEWLKTDVGKALLPARGAQGAGTAPGKAVVPTGGPLTKAQRDALWSKVVPG